MQVLADPSMFPNLFLALGLGAYPATVSVGGVVIVLRVDSKANVVVTGPDGRRIGVDPATGLPVNDFGDDGFDSGPGAPRHQAQPVGNHVVATGVAAVGDINNHDFILDPTGGIGFLGLP